MKVILVTSGSRGDVLPFIALAKALKIRGHQPTLSTHAMFRDEILAAEIDFHCLGGDPIALANTAEGRTLRLSRNPIAKWKAARRLTCQMLVQISNSIAHIVSEADCCIYGIGAIVAGEVAASFGVPHFPMSIQPMTTTSDLVSFPFANRSLNFGSMLNRLSYKFTDLYFTSRILPALNLVRLEKLNLGPMKSREYFRALNKQKKTILYAFSPSILPKPKDWAENNIVTGFWQENTTDVDLDPKISEFVRNSECPIYVGFGGATIPNPDLVNKIISDAITQSRTSAVLLTGLNNLGYNLPPEKAFRTSYVDLSSVLKSVKLAIHHGGAGTCVAAVKAGVPSIIIPFGADNALWGRCLERLGAGIVIPRSKLNSGLLSKTIVDIIRNPRFRRASEELREKIAGESGTQETILYIERHLQSAVES